MKKQKLSDKDITQKKTEVSQQDTLTEILSVLKQICEIQRMRASHEMGTTIELPKEVK